jgi:hypothetical protein
MRRLLAVALCSALAAPMFPDVSLADPATPAPHPAARPAAPVGGRGAGGGDTGDCAAARRAGRTCELTIDPETVGGERVVPGGSDLRARRFEPTGSLLVLRRDFVAEIVHATDDL